MIGRNASLKKQELAGSPSTESIHVVNLCCHCTAAVGGGWEWLGRGGLCKHRKTKHVTLGRGRLQGGKGARAAVQRRGGGDLAVRRARYPWQQGRPPTEESPSGENRGINGSF